MVGTDVAILIGGFALVGLPFVLVGIFYARRGLRRLSKQAAIERLALQRVTDARAGQDVKLHGRVEPASEGEDPIQSAFSGESALAVRYEITEQRPDGDGGTDSREIHEAERAVPFRLVDDTGSIAVAADTSVIEYHSGHRYRTTVEKGQEPSERIRSYVASTPELDPATPGVGLGPVNFGGRARTYTEYSVRPDDELVVVGRVERDPDAPWGDSLVVRPTADGPGLVHVGSVADSESSGRLVALGYLLVGLVLALGPLAVLGWMLLEFQVL